MNIRKENWAATREALLASARDQFGEQGFDAASLIAIAKHAGVTTGALYHHFENKKTLFEQVAEAMEAQVQLEVNKRIGRKSPSVALLREIVEVSIEVLADEKIHRILLIDAPSVFGLERWREVEARYGLGALTALMSLLKAQDKLNVPCPEVAARLLLSLIIEAARMSNGAKDPQVTRKHAIDFLVHSIDGLRPSP